MFIAHNNTDTKNGLIYAIHVENKHIRGGEFTDDWIKVQWVAGIVTPRLGDKHVESRKECFCSVALATIKGLLRHKDCSM